jgi:glucose 1-dehydrogenase
MRALTVRPGVAGSLELNDVPEPAESDGSVLVESLAVGVCGTDLEIIHAGYGTAPPGDDLLILGHENIGRVLEAPADTFATDDLVVAFVRRPDPVPCPACSVGEWDMCLNGKYTEHGIAGLHGFMRERWRVPPDALVRIDGTLADVGVLMEPTTIVAKAWEQIERIGSRAYFGPKSVVVLGAGPIGLLAAMLGVQRGYQVHVFDIVKEGPKPQLVADLGATYHGEPLGHSELFPDIVMECTGVPEVVLDALTHNAINAVVCLTGVSTVGAFLIADVGGINRTTVLQNRVVFGTVNANRQHYIAAATALAAGDRAWLQRLISRTVSIDDYPEAFQRRPDDVKVVLRIAG